MKKIIALLMLTVLFSSCSGKDLSANLMNPFGDKSEEKVITLANGMRMDIEDDIDLLLKGDKIYLNNYAVQAKLMVKDNDTETVQFIDFPKIERYNKTTDIFDIPEELVYEDTKNGQVWEKDATKSGLMTYMEAKEYCRNFGEISYGKPFDIPTVETLKTILKDNDARIDTNTFKNLNDTYWTQHKYAYSFYYGDGVLVNKNKGLAYVRCVAPLDNNQNQKVGSPF